MNDREECFSRKCSTTLLYVQPYNNNNNNNDDDDNNNNNNNDNNNNLINRLLGSTLMWHGRLPPLVYTPWVPSLTFSSVTFIFHPLVFPTFINFVPVDRVTFSTLISKQQRTKYR